jgi:PhzF family phenazine biosynthesis protein
MSVRPFQQVDVFTAVPFKGNPVAVVLDANGMSAADMQAIARWTNLSETTFVSAPTHPEADYQLRIFSPQHELPFAGHPTIGSAHALLRHGVQPKRRGRLVQECAKGLVQLRMEGESLFLALPKPRFTAVMHELLTETAEALGIDPEDVQHAALIDVGPIWFTLQLRDAVQVMSLQPDMARIGRLPIEATGVNIFGLYDGGPLDVEVRSFAPNLGIPEDPVCGSGNGCAAALIQRERLLHKTGYRAGQGRCLGRDGHVQVRFEGDTIWLGGESVTCVEGQLYC